MVKRTFKAGTIVKVGGLPFELLEDTLVESEEGNFDLALGYKPSCDGQEARYEDMAFVLLQQIVKDTTIDGNDCGERAADAVNAMRHHLITGKEVLQLVDESKAEMKRAFGVLMESVPDDSMLKVHKDHLAAVVGS